MITHSAESLGLPLPRDIVVAVLLTDDPTPGELERHFRAAGWPPGVEAMVPEASAKEAIATWFGILEFPCVAVVMDGMLLGVEHACTPQACARLVAYAKSSRTPLLDV